MKIIKLPYGPLKWHRSSHSRHFISALCVMALPTFLTSTSLSALLLALASNIATSTATPSPNGFTKILLPSPNITGGPAAEIQCYALPYGAVGIISHLLTYWTIAWMGWGMVPLWPTMRMRYYLLDLLLAVATLCTCIPIASITIHRCRLSWHFILISIWKLVTSVSVACISIHRCIIVRQERKSQGQAPSNSLELAERGSTQSSRRDHSRKDEKTDLSPLLWLILYLAGTVIGMIGLCSLLWTSFRQDQAVRRLTYGFAAPLVIIPSLVAIYWYTENCFGSKGGRHGCTKAYRQTFHGALVAFVAVFGFFSALYGDLVLGVIADNVLGLPSADFAPLYWVWFIAKRLPLLSI